jgi:hypothetical protein
MPAGATCDVVIPTASKLRRTDPAFTSSMKLLTWAGAAGLFFGRNGRGGVQNASPARSWSFQTTALNDARLSAIASHSGEHGRDHSSGPDSSS